MVWPDAALGHRRLSIFDLSEAGKQPMLSADRSIGVVFNGAIYNFLELRHELRRTGYEFRSQTDTEVLLHGYLEWGIDRLAARIQGMFAFAIWDQALGRLFLVRDRLGVKPLAYCVRNEAITFASTPRALKAALPNEPELDPLAVAEFLEWGFVTDARSIYRSVRKLPPATILEWENGRISTREYWRPPASDAKIGFEDAVAETERLLLESVRLRLRTDVPAGALLSGGIDSSLVCWAASELGCRFKAFTIGVPGDPSDESADAWSTARRLGLRHETVVLPSAAASVQELASAFPEPFACSSALGMLRLSRAVKTSATVLLTGDGGDDVFLGYPEHRHYFFAERAARMLPRSASPAWRTLRQGVPMRGCLRRAVHFMDFVVGGLAAVPAASSGIEDYVDRDLLGHRLSRVRIPQREMAWPRELGRMLLTDFLEYDRKQRFTGEYLPKVDGSTMHHAIEARSPFLDHHLWSFASSLPHELRLKGGALKAVLRELARRKLGEGVARGRKRGFTVPAERWITGRWRREVSTLFEDSLLAENGWIREDAVARELNRLAPGEPSTVLWRLFVLETWMRHEQEISVERVAPRPALYATVAAR